CQDNALSWLDWSLLEEGRGKALAAFVARLTEARRRFITLRDDRYPQGGEIAPGISRQSWWDERGVELGQGDWDNGEGRILCLRRAARTGQGIVEVTALLLNAHSEPVIFKLPGELPWQLVLDSADPKAQPAPVSQNYKVADRAAVLLAATLA